MKDWSNDIRHYRKQADELTAEIDRLSDPVRLEREIASLTRRRDIWVQLADELEDYRHRQAEGLFDTEEQQA